MKVRTGFVSNSSSSSFVIGLPAMPKTWEELHLILFGQPEEKVFVPDWIRPENAEDEQFQYGSHSIAQNMFNQMEDQTPVSDKTLSKVCDPEKSPKWIMGDETPRGKKLVKELVARYGVRYPYCISPTNKTANELARLSEVCRKKHQADYVKRRAARWAKEAKKFTGLKKFVIMTQSDGGPEAHILAGMDCCWKQIVRRVISVPLTSH